VEKKVTHRGFDYHEFEDRYNAKCSLQKSSLAFENAIWFGVDDAEPKIMAKDTPEGGNGWVKYHIPEEVSLSTRMHLTQKHVWRLLPILIKFAFTGNV